MAFVTDHTDIDYARLFPFWDQLPEEQQNLVRKCSMQTCSDGEQIIINEENASDCLLVMKGAIRVFMSSQSGQEFTLFEVYPGNGCGLIPYENPVHPLLQACGETQFLLIHLSVMSSLMAVYPGAEEFFQFSVTGNLQTIVDNIESSFFSPLISSVAHTILVECPEGVECLRITHEQIANHIGTTREMVTREIRKLKAEGVIKSGRGSITVLNRERLRELAENHSLA